MQSDIFPPFPLKRNTFVIVISLPLCYKNSRVILLSNMNLKDKPIYLAEKHVDNRNKFLVNK